MVFVKYGGAEEAAIFPVLVPAATVLDTGKITDFGKLVVEVPVDTVDLPIGIVTDFCDIATCGE